MYVQISHRAVTEAGHLCSYVLGYSYRTRTQQQFRGTDVSTGARASFTWGAVQVALGNAFHVSVEYVGHDTHAPAPPTGPFLV